MPRLSFAIELQGAGLLEPIDLDALRQAFEAGALLGGEWIRGTWVRVAQGLNVRRSGDYLRGIESLGRVELEGGGTVLGPDGDASHMEVVIAVTNTAEHASLVEDGHAAFSMVAAIDWGNTSGSIKRGPNGPYLHIPFRHAAYASMEKADAQGLTMGTRRSMMPSDVYGQAQRLQYRQRRNAGRQFDASGQFVAADRYQWQHPEQNRRRLDRSHVQAVFAMGGPGVDLGGHAGSFERRATNYVGRDAKGNPLINPTWKSSKFHGLMKTGSKGHSVYMTIRTISPKSKGWNIPAQAGLGIARRLADYASSSQELQAVIQAGMMKVLQGGQP